MKAVKLAELIAQSAADKKADDVVLMEMSRVSGMCDYFVICGATSTVRAKTIAENIVLSLKKRAVSLLHREGFKEGHWILLDFGDVVAHVFHQPIRQYYNLEQLWGDAPRRKA
jgi:ribosome-associated protein